MKNTVRLIFTSLPENEPFARGAVGAFVLPLNPTLSELSDLKTVVSEAVTNCIVHAYRTGPGLITIDCTIEDDTVTLIVSDSGVGISDVSRALQPFYSSLDGEEHCGMGFTIMQTFMDDFAIVTEPSKGTTLTMKKRFGEEDSAAEEAVNATVRSPFRKSKTPVPTASADE